MLTLPTKAAVARTLHDTLLRPTSLHRFAYSRSRGFTLLELLVVLAITAIAAGAVSLTLRDSSSTSLEREAQRLAAVLESGRSLSRTTGLPLRWQPSAEGFKMVDAGADPQVKPAITPWLTAGVIAQTNTPQGTVLLGPEPMIPAQAITLRLDDRQIRVWTDGLQPFRQDVGSDAGSPAEIGGS
jgi:general secretion pathway protein H